MQTLSIFRTIKTPKNVLGFGTLTDKNNKILFNFVSLELPYLENKKQISCVPAGTYRAYKTKSPSKGNVLYIQNVSGRSSILVHVGNYSKDTKGCILVGKNIDFSEGINEHFITSSKITMDKILELCENELFIKII